MVRETFSIVSFRLEKEFQTLRVALRFLYFLEMFCALSSCEAAIDQLSAIRF